MKWVGAPGSDLGAIDGGAAYLILGPGGRGGLIGAEATAVLLGEDSGDEAGRGGTHTRTVEAIDLH